MCHFPRINYQQNIPALVGEGNNILPRRVRAMRTLLINRNHITAELLPIGTNMIELENAITNAIDAYNNQDNNLETIFHLIQIWGGQSGRGIYLRQEFSWERFCPIYKELIDSIRQITEISDNSCDQAINSITLFIDQLSGIGYRGMKIAFITKHVHFWTHRNLPDNMLPIYDSTFAMNITEEGRNASLQRLMPFWRAMRQEAINNGIGLTSLERQLFNYYQGQ